MISFMLEDVKQKGLSIVFTDNEVEDLYSELNSLAYDSRRIVLNRIKGYLSSGKDFRWKQDRLVKEEVAKKEKEAELVSLRQKVERRKLLRYLKRKKEMKKK